MHFLTYGSVVCVKGFDYPLMIVDWTPKIYKEESKHVSFLKSMLFNSTLRAIDDATREFTLYDYLACPWPSGYILDTEVPEDKSKAITRVPFNHEDIESVLFIGPYDEVFSGHDKESFSFAVENNLPIAKFYEEGKGEELDVQTLKSAREKTYQIPPNINETNLLPIGSVVVVEYEDEGERVKRKDMICSVGSPFYVVEPEYEVFGWEHGSVFTDDLNLAFFHKDILEVISLGYVTAEVQHFLTTVEIKQPELPLINEVKSSNPDFRI